jgi:hypothetical protein
MSKTGLDLQYGSSRVQFRLAALAMWLKSARDRSALPEWAFLGLSSMAESDRTAESKLRTDLTRPQKIIPGQILKDHHRKGFLGLRGRASETGIVSLQFYSFGLGGNMDNVFLFAARFRHPSYPRHGGQASRPKTMKRAADGGGGDCEEPAPAKSPLPCTPETGFG